MTREEQLQRESEVYAWTANQFDIQLAFKKGAEWEHKRLIEKTCGWLENNFVCFLQGAKRGIYSNQFATVEDMVDNFKRTMKE